MKMFRNLVIMLAMLIFLPMLAGCHLKTVPPGYVGVKFNLYGDQKGIKPVSVGSGRYWLSYNEYLYEYPTFKQTYNWTRSANEGRAVDESISFQTSQGLTVNADVGITYSVEPDKVPLLFQTYRKGVEEITDVYLRNMVRDALIREASTLDIESVYGSKKAAMMDAVNKDVANQVKPLGINIDKIFFLGELRLPENVMTSINSKVQATQMAEQRQNEVAQAEAEARKVEAEANGRANAQLTIAKAEAQAISLRGEALRNNPGVAQLNAIEKWDGHLPVNMYGSAATPFVNVPVSK